MNIQTVCSKVLNVPYFSNFKDLTFISMSFSCADLEGEGGGRDRRPMVLFYFHIIRIVRPAKRDWAVLSKDTPVDFSIYNR